MNVLHKLNCVLIYVLLIALCGCMSSFDRKVETKHWEHMRFRAMHTNEFQLEAKRADWFALWGWDHFLSDRSWRGFKYNDGLEQRNPTHGRWATFWGRCMMDDVERCKKAFQEGK